MLALKLLEIASSARSHTLHSDIRSLSIKRHASFERLSADTDPSKARSFKKPVKRNHLERNSQTRGTTNPPVEGSINRSRNSNPTANEAKDTPSKTRAFKSVAVNPEIKAQLEKLRLGKIRLPRQSKADYGKQRDLSAFGETGETSTTAYFPPSGCRLIGEASDESRFPAEVAPEVCFVGRSNVGKSSLLNAIVGVPLSKTSSKPGETTNVRWYSNSDLITLVDLPGYGFSFAQETRSSVWMEAAKQYLQRRKALKRCFVLLDSRQPLKRSDESTMQFLEECNVTYQVVLTKADLVSVDDLARRVEQMQVALRDHFPRAIPNILVVSSHNRSGLAPLRKQLISLFPAEKLEAFEKLRDKKFAAAQKRRAKRAEEAEHQRQVELHRQRMHSRRALLKQVRQDKKTSQPSL